MGKKNPGQNYTKLIIYSIVIILLNMAGTTLFFRLDLTKNKMYSLSPASRKAVSTLSEPLTVNVFFTKNLPAPYNNTEQYLHDLLEEYALFGNKYFNYRFYDVSSDMGEGVAGESENRKLAESYGINPLQIQNIDKDQLKYQKAYMGLVLIHGDMVEKIPAITTTDGLEYKLTTTIRKLNNKISALLALKDKIHVKLYLSSSLERVAPLMHLKKLSELPGKIQSIIKDINQKNYQKIAYEYLDPAKDKNLEKDIRKFNIMTLEWPAIPNKGLEAGEGAIGMVISHKDRSITIPVLNVVRLPIFGTQYSMVDMKELPDMINGNIEGILDINESIGYLADHGTLSESPSRFMNPAMPKRRDSVGAFRSLLSKNYSIKNVNLNDGSIPESLKCLIIARPTEKFTDYQLFQIDQFLMKGKSLALFLDKFKEKAPGKNNPYSYGRPSYIPINTGLEKLLKHYGMSLEPSYVMDENCYKQRVRNKMGGGERPIYFAPIIKDRFINHDFDFMKNINEMIVMKNSPVKLFSDEIKKNGLKAATLISSSDKSWAMKGRINLNPMFIRPPTADKKSYPLACIVEGQFSSYFAGKSIPVKEVKKDEKKPKTDKKDQEKKPDKDLSMIKGQGEIITKSKPARIFLIGTSEVLKDNMMDEDGRGPNATFFMNVIDHLNNRDDISAMRGKVQKFNPLAETSEGLKTFIKAFNIVGLPVLVVIFGLLVLYARISRKKRIRMMFQR